MSHDNEGNGISVHLVKLDSSSPEYQKVMDRIFRDSPFSRYREYRTGTKLLSVSSLSVAEAKDGN